MRIAWFCIPAFGHVNPTLGLVKEMVGAGHEVFYFSFEQFREAIEGSGADFISCDAYDLNIDTTNGGNRVGKDIAFSIELIVESILATKDLIEQTFPNLKPDLIVSDSMACYGKMAAMKYEIPYVCSNATFAFNRYSVKYMDQGWGSLWRMLLALPKIQKQLKRLREKGFPVKNFLELISNNNETHTIVYTSKEFQPYAETFSDKYRFIGPSIRPIQYPMSKTSEKTVYVSMGTVISVEDIFEKCIEALRETDYQTIVSLGETKSKFSNLPGNIQVYDFVDQTAVLNIADAFITHCGMNSVSEALYFKVPLILVPQTPEQTAVARRVEELGAGVMLPTSKRTVKDIKDAIEKVLNESAYKDAAVEISEGFKRTGGIKEGRRFLESIMK